MRRSVPVQSCTPCAALELATSVSVASLVSAQLQQKVGRTNEQVRVAVSRITILHKGHCAASKPLCTLVLSSARRSNTIIRMLYPAGYHMHCTHRLPSAPMDSPCTPSCCCPLLPALSPHSCCTLQECAYIEQVSDVQYTIKQASCWACACHAPCM